VELYRGYPLLFALLALGVVAPYELAVLAVTGHSPFAAQTGNVSAALILTLIDFVVVGPLISALYIHAVRAVADRQRPEPRQVVLRGLRVLPNVAAAQIVATIGIAIGFLALVIPGVLLLIRWAVVAQAAAIENENWIEALRRSGQLTAHNYLHVLGVLLLTGLIAVGLRNLGLAVLGSRTNASAVAVGIVVETVARSFVALCTAVLFFDLLARARAAI
jgi:hypothetical protein